MDDWAGAGPQGDWASSEPQEEREDWGNTESQGDWAGNGEQQDWTVESKTGPKQPKQTEAGNRKSVKDTESNRTEESAKQSAKKDGRERVEPYINPNRVETGGQQRSKLTPEELAEKMEKIRIKNAQIKERREKIEQDKQAFTELMEKDNARAKRQAQVQAHVNSTRDENARKKLDRQSNRAWDQDKKVQKERFNARGRGGRQKQSFGRHNDTNHANHEAATAAALNSESTTTDEVWSKPDDQDIVNDGRSSDAPVRTEESGEKDFTDDEWGKSNAENWAD